MACVLVFSLLISWVFFFGMTFGSFYYGQFIPLTFNAQMGLSVLATFCSYYYLYSKYESFTILFTLGRSALHLLVSIAMFSILVIILNFFRWGFI